MGAARVPDSASKGKNTGVKGAVALTVSTKVSLVLKLPSLTVTVMVAVPVWLVAGVTVKVRLAPLPPRTMLPFGTNVGLDEEPLTTRLAAVVSTSPIARPIGPVDVPWLMVLSARFEIVGASFTAFTVSKNVSLALNNPSLTVTVIVAVPDWLAAGVTVTVRLAPLPPKTILLTGTKVGLEEAPLSVRLPVVVWASLPPTRP